MFLFIPDPSQWRFYLSVKTILVLMQLNRASCNAKKRNFWNEIFILSVKANLETWLWRHVRFSLKNARISWKAKWAKLRVFRIRPKLRKISPQSISPGRYDEKPRTLQEYCRGFEDWERLQRHNWIETFFTRQVSEIKQNKLKFRDEATIFNEC